MYEKVMKYTYGMAGAIEGEVGHNFTGVISEFIGRKFDDSISKEMRG
jgi:hypothetical protein